MGTIADDTQWMDATAQAELVLRGDVTPEELVDAAIERIEALDGPINAVIMKWYDHAREVAATSVMPGAPFRGVPFLLKDLWASYEGQVLTNGHVALEKAQPISTADTTIVSRFRAAGLVPSWAVSRSPNPSPTARRGTRGTPTASLVARAGVPVLRSRPAWCPSRTPPTVVVRFGSRRHAAV